ncbi:tryptophan halogenase [Ruegeria marisrubri]|uniref:Tryptophan halogenase n=1 Tax=Ruegeria marisrubri TaxID=1685379 RepID=A0A0X3TCF5_9RHOB|nr:FAD-dependent oxidoreductase [Ruegeria marisrubri]KUJ73467.1 tryptophan halogenase [Ruegeria marisrubri]
MPPRVCEAEICVVGGGPAGAATALRLAQLGHDVCLLERHAFPRPHVGESLPPSVLPLLQSLGLRERVEHSGVLLSHGAILYWGGAFERRGTQGGPPGLLVDRGRFDALLLQAAAQAGVRVLQPVRAHRPRRTAQGWDIPLRGETDIPCLRAQVLIDAAGRQAGLGRRFRRCSEPLLALYAYWQAPRGFGPETRIEAGETHWYWGALLPDGTVNAMVLVDPSECTGLSPAGRRDLYLNLLAQSTLLSPCLEGRRIGPVRRCDATSHMETTPPARDLLRVGEASFSLDPLSSQGVQSALGQAMQAAAVAHTVLTQPENGDLALAFHSERQGERVRAHANLAAEYYARQARHRPTGFWTGRAAPPAWLAQDTPDPRREKLPGDVPLHLSPRAALCVSGVQTGPLITPGHVLTHPHLGRPVALLDGVPIAPLLEQMHRATPADQILQGWSASLGPARAGKILNWLWQNRILVPASGQPIPVSSAARMA